MKANRRNLTDLIISARRRQLAKVLTEDRQAFSRETVARWRRQPTAVVPDLWLLWKRACIGSLATAVAVVIAVAVFHPTSPVAENPFEIVLGDNDDSTLF